MAVVLDPFGELHSLWPSWSEAGGSVDVYGQLAMAILSHGTDALGQGLTHPTTETLGCVYYGNGFLICAPANLVRNIRPEHHQLHEMLGWSFGES